MTGNGKVRAGIVGNVPILETFTSKVTQPALHLIFNIFPHNNIFQILHDLPQSTLMLGGKDYVF